MNLRELLEKYGRVTDEFYDGTVQGVVNGFSLEIEEIKHAYTVKVFVNDGIRKFFENIEQVESFLLSLK
jgi:hypothetical protein